MRHKLYFNDARTFANMMRRIDLNDEIGKGVRRFVDMYPEWQKSGIRKLWEGYAGKAIGMYCEITRNSGNNGFLQVFRRTRSPRLRRSALRSKSMKS